MNNNVLFLFLAVCLTYFVSSCNKEDTEDINLDFVISKSLDPKDEILIDTMLVDITGGIDTLYIHTGKTFNTRFESKDLEDWVEILKIEQVSNTIHRVILDIKPLASTFAIRSGILSLTTDDLDGQFLKISQGYVLRYVDNFNWLKYGVVNPLDAGREVLMKDWTVTQNANGWTSTLGTDQLQSFVYGRYEHIKIGSEEYGADLISRHIGGIERDSLLVLSFNAVAYASDFEGNDANILGVELQNGCTFLDGSTFKQIELDHYDAQSALIISKFWENSFYALKIKKPETNTVVSTIKVRFVTGDSIEKEKNRVFIDNFSIYSMLEFNK